METLLIFYEIKGEKKPKEKLVITLLTSHIFYTHHLSYYTSVFYLIFYQNIYHVNNFVKQPFSYRYLIFLKEKKNQDPKKGNALEKNRIKYKMISAYFNESKT